MKKILIILIFAYSCSCLGQIPLMVNNKPNKTISNILQKKYNCYIDTCINLINNRIHKPHYDLKKSNINIKVFCFINLKNKELLIDSTINIMNEILIDTISRPAMIQFYKNNILWCNMLFASGNAYIAVLDEMRGQEYNVRKLWEEIFANNSYNVFFIKGEEWILLQKDNHIYYYYQFAKDLKFTDRLEPLGKYLMNKPKEEKLPEGWDVTN